MTRADIERRMTELEDIVAEYDWLRDLLSLIEDGSLEEENGRLFIPAGKFPWDPNDLLNPPER